MKTKTFLIFLFASLLAVSCSIDDTTTVTDGNLTTKDSTNEKDDNIDESDSQEKENSGSPETDNPNEISQDSSQNADFSEEEQSPQNSSENDEDDIQSSIKNYTVTLITTAEESSAEPYTQTGEADQTILLPSAESLGVIAPVGKVFIGWSTIKNSETAQYKDCDNILLDSDMTLYAIYHTYKIGDIILANGEIISVDDVSEMKISESNPPIAVIAFIGDKTVPAEEKSGMAFGVCLRHGKRLSWYSGSLRIMYPNFPKINCYCKDAYHRGYSLNKYSEFGGDCDGSDNWEVLKTIYQQYENEYPVFQYANYYGEKGDTNVQNTQFENGWYVPSLAELAYIYRNKDIIDSSMEKIDGELLGEGRYFSSSQSGWSNVNYTNINEFAYLARFRDGTFTSPDLDSTGFSSVNDVIVVRALN